MSIGFAPLLLIVYSPFASVYGFAMVPISFLYRTHTKKEPCSCLRVNHEHGSLLIRLSYHHHFVGWVVANFNDIYASDNWDCNMFCGSWQGCNCPTVNGIYANLFTYGFINVNLIFIRIHYDIRIINIFNSSVGSKIGSQGNTTIYNNTAWILCIIVAPPHKMITIVWNCRTCRRCPLFILTTTCNGSH